MTAGIGGMAERRGKGLQIPLHGFKSRFHLHSFNEETEYSDSHD